MHQPGNDCCTENRSKSQWFRVFYLSLIPAAMCWGGVFLTDNCCGKTGDCRENEGDCDKTLGCALGFECGSSNCDDSGPGDKFWPRDDCCTRVNCWGTDTACCKGKQKETNNINTFINLSGQCLEGQGPCLYKTDCEDGFECQDVCEYGMCCTQFKGIDNIFFCK